MSNAQEYLNRIWSAREHLRANPVPWDGLCDGARGAMKTCFRVESEDDGYRVSWGNDPLDFIWQTEAQMLDLVGDIALLIDIEKR